MFTTAFDDVFAARRPLLPAVVVERGRVMVGSGGPAHAADAGALDEGSVRRTTLATFTMGAR